MKKLTPLSSDLLNAQTRSRKQLSEGKGARASVAYRNALGYLQEIQKHDNPEAVIESLFPVYGLIDHFDEYLSPHERKFFPRNLAERTYEKYLALFPTIFEILRDAHERYELKKHFNTFWEICNEYLDKCDYRDFSFMAIDGMFYKQSFNYWRREFNDTIEGLNVMIKFFRACFGIVGNDDYCRFDTRGDSSYSWDKMKACLAALEYQPGGLN